MAIEYNIERVNFLIVEDNAHMRNLVKVILNAFGVHNIAEAADGADAFKILRHFLADIIICDWVMQPLDGLGFVQMIRTGKDSPNPYVPVIMLTGYTEMNRVVEARDAGVNEFLAKPVSAKKIYSRIRAIIENNRPFIKTKTFFGPDRRRQNMANYRGSERRKAQTDIIAAQQVLHVDVVEKPGRG
ncbi:MAG: response regulator [candidate division Zixibacteria bacterium]|nr:response regulator [candidate division Zixibacteria bacterium]